MQLYMQPEEVISHLKRAVPDFVLSQILLCFHLEK